MGIFAVLGILGIGDLAGYARVSIRVRAVSRHLRVWDVWL